MENTENSIQNEKGTCMAFVAQRPMFLTLERRARRPGYTIGRLMVDGKYFCDTLEDRDRGLSQDMTAEELARRKVPGETAIPRGRYRVTTSVMSRKYGRRMPRLLRVPGFEGILIHAGNTARDTCGCILVGRNTVVGALTKSRDTFEKLYAMMQQADRIELNIV